MSKVMSHTKFNKLYERIVCEYCNHNWQPVVENPIRCPECGKILRGERKGKSGGGGWKNRRKHKN